MQTFMIRYDVISYIIFVGLNVSRCFFDLEGFHHGFPRFSMFLESFLKDRHLDAVILGSDRSCLSLLAKTPNK